MTTNQPYIDHALAGKLADFDGAAGPGNVNNPLFILSCGLLEYANAGAISLADAERIARDRAEKLGHADHSIRDTWRSAMRRVGSTAAVIPEPKRTGASPHPQGYADLAAYAAAHGVPADTLVQMGWSDSELYEYAYTDKQGKPATALTDQTRASYLRRRRALRFETPAGPRWRLIDEDHPNPKYWHPFGTHQGDQRAWYRLPEALALAEQVGCLVLCNGEASTVAAQYHGVPATAEAGGGEKAIPDHLLQHLRTVWTGDVVIALEGDGRGRKAAATKVNQLRSAGINARAVDLGLAGSEDLADFCRLHQSRALDHLRKRPDLDPHAPPSQQAPHAAPPRTLPVSHADDLHTVISPLTWLIPGIIPLDALSQVFAPGGTGKSLLALDMALTVAQTHTVLYVAAEAPSELIDRLAAWQVHHQRGTGELYVWREPVMLIDAVAVGDFAAYARAIGAAMIIVDPLASCMVGLEESSTGDMAKAVEALNTIRRTTGAAIHVVHHTGWSETHERGSSVLRAACRIVLKLSSDGDGLLTLSCEKANNGKPFETRYLRTVQSGEAAVILPASKVLVNTTVLTSHHIATLEALSLRQYTDGATFTQVLDAAANIAKSTLSRSFSTLLQRGLIEHSNRIYTITPKGTAALAAAIARGSEAPQTTTSPHADGLNWSVVPPSSTVVPVCSTFVPPVPDPLELVEQPGTDTHAEVPFTASQCVVPAVPPESAQNGVCSTPHGTTCSTQFQPHTASQCDSSSLFQVCSRFVPPSFPPVPPFPPLKGTGRGTNETEHPRACTEAVATNAAESSVDEVHRPLLGRLTAAGESVRLHITCDTVTLHSAAPIDWSVADAVQALTPAILALGACELSASAVAHRLTSTAQRQWKHVPVPAAERSLIERHNAEAHALGKMVGLPPEGEAKPTVPD